MRAVAQWSFAHRRIVVVGWLVVLVAITAISRGAGSAYEDNFRLKQTDSARALALLRSAAPRAAGDTIRIVVHTRRGRVTDPAVRRQVSAMLARVGKLPNVTAVVSPYSATGRGQIARSGDIAYAAVTLRNQASDVPIPATQRLVRTARSAGTPDLQVELGGTSISRANRRQAGGTGIAALAAAIVLFIVFGSLAAMALPLICAGVSLGIGIAVIGLLSHGITIASFAEQLSLLIGLGVGVDYALFILTRYRQGLLRGLTPPEAIAVAADTAGRAVFFAGITVCIALLGMLTLGVSFLYGVAIAASIAVAFTVAAALTLLPALLGFFGRRVLTRRQRAQIDAQDFAESDESPGWARWARVMERAPGAFAAGAAILMVVIALPLVAMRMGSSDEGNDPSSTTTRRAYDLLARGFGPGFNGPLQLVARTPTPADEQRFAAVVAAARRTDHQVVAVSAPRRVGPDVSIAQIIPRGSPQDASTADLVHRLRNDVVPHTAGPTTVYVGGQTAIFEDFASVLAGKLPLFIGVVVGLSFLLLMALFRSLLVPLTAAVMNLLSVGAAMGVVTAMFQWGWLLDTVGIDRKGPIESFLPVMVFAILFGLSMDYEVFLLSRIREEWLRRGDNREAVTHGLAATGRTITAAAAIMVLVFSAFVLGGDRVIKLFGVGLATAVFLDAVVVRSVLIPGLMLVFGRANWKFPRVLDRAIPRLDIEPPESRP